MPATARLITEFKGIHRGADVWVLGSGSSLGFVDPAFFHGRITIGVNYAYRRFPVHYTVGKELPQHANDERSHRLVVARHLCGNIDGPRCEYEGGDYWVFDHAKNRETEVDWSVLGTDRIIVSYSTITSAMHVAAYMGAANIILCGTDGGTIDGRVNYDGYYPDDYQYREWYREWVAKILPQTRELRDRLREVYGCRVYSLNPFTDLLCEGKEFVPCGEGGEQCKS